MAYITGLDRKQTIIFPDCLDDYITPESLVRIFDAFVDSLDMEACGFSRHIPATEGRPGYDPRDMVKLFIYGYFYRIRSSRCLMRETQRNVEVMWLINKLSPDFRTISDFRQAHVKALKKVFKEFNKLCVEMDLYSDDYISVDGSKFKAVNSKDRNFTLSKLDDRLERLQAQIDDYMLLLEKTDKEEEADERSFTKAEIEAKVKGLREREAIYKGYREEMEKNKISQMSLTDRESKLMKMNRGFGVCFNVQTAISSKHHLIAGYEVTDHPTDYGLLEGVAEEVKADFGLETIEATVDKGYRDGPGLMNCLLKGTIPHVAPLEGKTEIELETEHVSAEVTEEMKKSKKAEDIATCIKAGVIPEVYEGLITEIAIVEEAYYENVEEEASTTPVAGKTEIGLETEHVSAEDTEEMKKSKKAQDISACIKPGEIPDLYEGLKTEIAVEEETSHENTEEEASTTPLAGKTEIEAEYVSAEDTEEMKKSKKAEDIETCIKIGEIPEEYEGVKAEIAVVEETSHENTEEEAAPPEGTVMTEEAMVLKAKEGNYVRDIEKNRVYCPAGKILRQKSEKKDGSKRYYNKLGCANCASKCTKSGHKEVDFPIGRTIIASQMKQKAETEATLQEKKKVKRIKKTRQVVKVKFKPDRKKLDNRKCLSEHPFGTIKGTMDGSYFLLKGKEKASGEMALLCIAYNLKRAINVLGTRKILEVLAEKAA